MTKWWLLLSALALWLVLGYALPQPQEVDAQPGPGGRQGPGRIVSLAPNLTEVLFALGLGEKVVGVTQDSDYPPAAADKPRVGSFWQPSIEAVIATRPDLIVTLAFEQQKDLARRLGRMGYECLVVDIERVGDLFRAIDSIGQAADASVEARELNRSIQEDIRRVRTAIDGMREVNILWVVQREPLRVAGRDTFINEMIELAGGENAIGSTLYTYPPIGAEELIATSPEVIIEPTMANDTTDLRGQALSYWRKFTTVPAVRDERIYVIDGDLVSRLGPRLPAGIEAIAECLRPERPGE